MADCENELHEFKNDCDNEIDSLKQQLSRTQDDLNEAKDEIDELVELVKTKDKMLDDKNIEIDLLKNGMWTESESNSFIS